MKHLREQNIKRMDEWKGMSQEEILAFVLAYPEDAALLIAIQFSAIELAGETGELMNIVKKMSRETLGSPGNKETPEELVNLFVEELGDVVICADLLGIRGGVELTYAVPYKFNKTSVKVGLKTKMTEVEM